MLSYNWQLLEVKNNASSFHKTRSWYLLCLCFQNFRGAVCPFDKGVLSRDPGMHILRIKIMN